MDPEESRAIARQGAQRLAALVDEAGRFLYRYDAATGAVLDGYSAARHAACVWFLALAANRLAEPGLVPAASRAMRWLEAHHLVPFGEHGIALAEDDAVELGGTALALLAAAELDHAGEGEARPALARRLGRHLLGQRRPDGDFIHRRARNTGRAEDFRSPFSTGQALLALAVLGAAIGGDEVLAPALASETVLAGQNYGAADQSHWMLYAIEALEAVAPVAAHRAHARRIAGTTLVYPVYRDLGKSTAIACRCEGLVAYLGMLRRQPRAEAAELPTEALVRPHLEQDLALLRPYRTEDGAFVKGRASREVRIDYVLHAAAGFLGHALLFSGT